MKKLLALLLFVFISANFYAQEVSDTIPKLLKKAVNETELKLSEPKENAVTQPQQEKPEVEAPVILPDPMAGIPLTLPPLNLYIGPPTQYTASRLPHFNDYAYGAMYRATPELHFATLSGRASMLGVGESVSVSSYVHYQPTSRLELSGGVTVSKMLMYEDRYNRYNFDASMRFRVTDYLFLNGYAGYNSRQGFSTMGPMPMMHGQGAYYGGTVEVKFSKVVGIEAGMVRSINPYTGKWQNELKIAPVFYVK